MLARVLVVCFFNIFSGNNMNAETASMQGSVVCWWGKKLNTN